MVAQRKRWFLNTVLVASLLGFVGFSVAPLLVQPPKSPEAAASPGAADRNQQLTKQIQGYEAVLQREPDNQAALRGLVEVRLQLGDVKGTIAPLEKLAKLNPAQSEYSVLLAQVKQQTGDREGAAKTYRDLLTTRPGDLKALQGIVGLMLQQNKPAAAIGILQDTLKLAPQLNASKPGSIDVSSTQLILGQVFAEQKRYDEALGLYEEIQKLDPKDFRPILAKAIILKTQGKSEAEYATLFETASTLAPAQYKDEIARLAKSPGAATIPPAMGAPAGSDPGAATGGSTGVAPGATSGGASGAPSGAPGGVAAPTEAAPPSEAGAPPTDATAPSPGVTAAPSSEPAAAPAQ